MSITVPPKLRASSSPQHENSAPTRFAWASPGRLRTGRGQLALVVTHGRKPPGLVAYHSVGCGDGILLSAATSVQVPSAARHAAASKNQAVRCPVSHCTFSVLATAQASFVFVHVDEKTLLAGTARAFVRLRIRTC